MRSVVVYPVILVLLLADVAGCQKPQPAMGGNQVEGVSPWTLLSVRDATSEDVPFEESSKYLWPSPDPNTVPGPDSLRALVLTNEESRAHIYIEDLRTGSKQLLFEGSATHPSWSPDGRFVSCCEWKSATRPYELCIVQRSSGEVFTSDLGLSATRMKWSPDSQTLAASGVYYREGKAALYTVSLPGYEVRVLDTNAAGTGHGIAGHVFSWSPNGRWLAFVRPTEVHRFGDVIAADLWVVEATTGVQWPILETSEWVEADPLWISNTSIQVDRARWIDEGFADNARVVVELSLDETTRPMH